MTSAITTTNIDGAFPIAGQDNNSQGFRDNFTNIKTGLNTAKSEITALQTNTAKLNANNNFNGNMIENAELNQVYGSVRNNGTISTTTSIDLENGPLQIYTLAGSATLQFTNWPASDLYAKIRLHLKSNTADSSVINVTFSTEAGGTILKSGDGAAFPSPFTLNINGAFRVVEAWTYNAGTTVYLKYLGEFT
jgi:hypothetical protein